MKKIISIILLIAMTTILFAGCGNNNGTTGAKSEVKALAIDEIKADPLSFTGEITITGVNAGFAQQDPKIFFVVDTAELLTCKNLQCGAYQLPVIYKGEGPMPEIADEVDIVGNWGKYEVDGEKGKESVDIFEITKIDVKRNIMNLLQ